MKNKKKLLKKVAVITGAGGFLGYTHAYSILEIGGSVILTDISKSKMYQNFNSLKKIFPKENIFMYLMDVTKEKNVIEVHKKILKKFNKVDILINNASIDSKIVKSGKMTNSSSIEKIKIAQWNKEIEVGLTGYFICSRVFGSHMALKKGGIIINVASDLSIISPNQSIYKKNQKKPITYSVIKTGILGITRYLSTYWAKSNVRVNTISPGPIYNNQNKKFVKKLSSLIPMGRMSERKELIGSIQYLSSDASSYVTGHNLIVDGGRTII